MVEGNSKPLGAKAYGSIPHLPNSRTGPMDYHCHEGQAEICAGGGRNRRGDRHRVIVTEKLDGSNVCVANIAGSIVALTRAGYLAQSSQHKQHHVFADWVRSRDWSALPVGHRLSGEWMYQAHGTMYKPDAPFIAFDVFSNKKDRYLHDDARDMFDALGVVGAHVIHDGNDGLSVADALSALGVTGFHGAQEQVEGAVWRVETGGKFNFLAKYVMPEKVDGKYFEAVTGEDVVYMCDPLNAGV